MPNQAAVDYAFDIAKYILQKEREAVASSMSSDQVVTARIKALRERDEKERQRAEARGEGRLHPLSEHLEERRRIEGPAKHNVTYGDDSKS